MKLRLPTYGWRQFLGDAQGGFVAALIALPYGLALAALMGLPPVLGVYTSILTVPVLVLLGRNPVLIGGTSSVTVPFIAAAFDNQGIGGAAKVSIVASIFMLTFSVLKLGRFVAKVPLVVVSGFSCGIGAMMIISQLKTMMGVQIERGGPIILDLVRAIQKIGEAHPLPFALSVLVIITATLTHKYFPKAPAPLIGAGAATLIAVLVGFKGTLVGRIPDSIPPFIGFSWAPQDVWEVLPQAFALAVVSSVNLLITSRVVEHFRGRRHPIKRAAADAELGAYGLANLSAGIFGAPMSVGIPARSLANVRCGGTTRMSNLIHALILVGFLTMMQDVLAIVPTAALAGVTAWMGIGLLEWSTWRRLPKMRKLDARAFLATAVSTLLTNAVAAVALGCSFYVVEYLYRRWTERVTPVEAVRRA